MSWRVLRPMIAGMGRSPLMRCNSLISSMSWAIRSAVVMCAVVADRKADKALIDRLKDSGVAILLNSHLLSEVELVCDTVAILAKGRVLKEGTMAEVVPEGRNLEDVFVELIQANTPQHDQLPSFITEQEKK